MCSRAQTSKNEEASLAPSPAKFMAPMVADGALRFYCFLSKAIFWFTSISTVAGEKRIKGI